MGDAARDAYSRELDEALLPRVAGRFRQRLLDYAAEPEKLYPYLKGYLMLGDPSHLDKDWLRYLADLEWPDGGASDSARGQQFGQHFQSLLEYRQQLRRIEIDPVIVAQARSTLRQASMPVLVYSYVRIRYADDVARALRLDEALGLGADRVLRRAGARLADPVPSIYTKPVFEEIVAKAPADLDVFISEYWVWGDARPAIASAQLMAAFLDVYEKDYIAAWERILRDVQPIPSGGLADTKEALAILSGSASPLRALLKTVYDHTYLVKPPEAAQPAERGGVGERLGGVFKGGQNRAAVAAVPPGSQVTKHFEEFHRLVAGDNPPIGVVIQKLQELQKTLAPIGTGVGERPPGDPASVNDVGQLAIEIRREAAPLPPTIAGIVTQVADRAMVGVRGGLQTILENRYQQEVVRECRLIVADSYPFVPTSAANVTLVDFGRLFGFGGLYDNFFKAELSKLVDTSRSPWSWLRDASGATVGGSAQMLRRVEAARRIRDLYFPTGSMEPELRFTITPENLDGVATGVTLEIDGQQVVYRHTPPRPVAMKWPGPKPGLVVITFEGPGGSRPFLTFQGAWAWLRFVDASNPQRTSKERLTLTSSAGAHEVQLLLEAPSIRNPYGDGELQDFRCE
jgi:type VI secretion system protein ImpL